MDWPFFFSQCGLIHCFSGISLPLLSRASFLRLISATFPPILFPVCVRSFSPLHYHSCSCRAQGLEQGKWNVNYRCYMKGPWHGRPLREREILRVGSPVGALLGWLSFFFFFRGCSSTLTLLYLCGGNTRRPLEIMRPCLPLLCWGSVAAIRNLFFMNARGH